jgi:hypothetical protein
MMSTAMVIAICSMSISTSARESDLHSAYEILGLEFERAGELELDLGIGIGMTGIGPALTT